MYLAYSALRTTDQNTEDRIKVETESQLRYHAYQTACSKYSRHIAVIRQYLPGWVPSPPVSP
jgi:hypothetical protein